ncbi:MAG: DNA recombination protein RmuC [Gemmatimonas sp.]
MDFAVIATVALGLLTAGLGAGLAAVLRERGRLEADRDEARALIVGYLAAKTESETRLAAAEAALAAARTERERAVQETAREREARESAERRAALSDQARTQIEQRMADWETVRAQTLDATKAALLETSTTLSSKLIEDHKREAEATKKESEELVKKTTDTLFKQFEDVARTVTSLHSEVRENRSMTETIHRALSNPAGAGHYAEIGLENTLRSFGLEPGRDFLIQHTVAGHEEGTRLRPDAVVFLPNDAVLAIDCKASKFLLEIADAEGTDREADAYASLAGTMNAHLRALASRDYATAITAEQRKAGKGERVIRAINIMYLPNEGAIERLWRADPEFQRKAVKEQISVVGPAGLMTFIGFARSEIDLGRQMENREHIVEATRQLLDAVAMAITHAAGIGKSLKAAATSHSKLIGSINARLLPRSRELIALGVRPAKAKELSMRLPAVQVIDSIDTLIEGEAEDVTTAGALPDASAGERD